MFPSQLNTLIRRNRFKAVINDDNDFSAKKVAISSSCRLMAADYAAVVGQQLRLYTLPPSLQIRIKIFLLFPVSVYVQASLSGTYFVIDQD